MEISRYARIALLALVFWISACADVASIGALCPVGCRRLSHDAVCDCSAVTTLDAGMCAGAACSAPDAGKPADAGACEAGARRLEYKRPSLMVVLDNSASLLPWWQTLSEGFLAFIRDEDSRGMGVGVMLADEVCEPSGYLPPLVPIAPLPASLATLEQSFPDVLLSTSTVPVFTASLQYARGWLIEHPGEELALLLLTDASPGACDGLTGGFEAEITRLASEAYAGSPSIKTYVVGGGGLALIDMIAVAGGTTAYPIATLASADDVLRALREIRGQPEPCAFVWPGGAAPAADTRVVVSSANGARRDFPIVTTCNQDGFYLEQQLLLACPRTCAALSSSDLLSLADDCP